MGVAFPTGSFSVTTPDGDTVIVRICDVCGAAVVEAEGTDMAFHQRWHRLTGSGSWIDPATGWHHAPGNPQPADGASG